MLKPGDERVRKDGVKLKALRFDDVGYVLCDYLYDHHTSDGHHKYWTEKLRSAWVSVKYFERLKTDEEGAARVNDQRHNHANRPA